MTIQFPPKQITHQPLNAVYPGTFDPITLGHEDLVRRASLCFDRLVLGVAASPAKKPLFSLAERVTMAQDVLADLPNVEVRGFDHLLISFVRECNAKVIVRGVRSPTDFDYEFQMASVHRSQHPDIETLFFTPNCNHQFISASLVREIARLDGKINDFVSPKVAAKLRDKFFGEQNLR